MRGQRCIPRRGVLQHPVRVDVVRRHPGQLPYTSADVEPYTDRISDARSLATPHAQSDAAPDAAADTNTFALADASADADTYPSADAAALSPKGDRLQKLNAGSRIFLGM